MSKKKFIACRIPIELDDALESYCEQQGINRSDAIIQGVAQHIGFNLPIKTQSVSAISESKISEERFLSLEKTVTNLIQQLAELNLKVEENFVTNNVNNTKMANSFEEETLHELMFLQEPGEEQEDFEENTIKDLMPSNFSTNTINNNINNIVIDEGNTESQSEDSNKLKPLKNINTTRVGSISNLTRKQIQYLLEKTIEKLKQEDKLGEPGMFLPEPIEVFHKDGITVNGYPYKLFYVGEDSKERPLWDLLPDDNKSYQPVIVELNHTYNN